MKFSVIVPIYNVRDYVSACIESILCQSYTDIEVILIDDGSTDFSGKICDSFALRDDRIKVIHKQNGGVSSSRNVGLRVSTGDYITFIDGDDMLSENAIEELANELKIADVVCYKWQRVRDNLPVLTRESLPFPNNTIFEKDKINLYSALLKSDELGSCCLKACRRDLLINNAIEFDENLYYLEDQKFCCKLLYCASRILFIDKAYYLYVERKESCVRKYSSERYSQITSFFDFLTSFSEKFNIEEREKKHLLQNRFYKSIYAECYNICRVYNLGKNEREKVFLELANKREVAAIEIKYLNRRLDRIFAKLIKKKYFHLFKIILGFKECIAKLLGLR